MKNLCFWLVLWLPVSIACGQGLPILNVPSGPYPTVQSAINAVPIGGTVLVAAGTYQEALNFPAKDFLLQGAGVGLSIIDANFIAACMTFTTAPVTNGMVVEGFSMTNGIGNITNLIGSAFPIRAGGGIFIEGAFNTPSSTIAPSFLDCEIYLNTSGEGAGLFMDFAGGARFERCDFHDNGAINLPGLSATVYSYSSFSDLAFVNCQFTDNTAISGSLIYLRESGAAFLRCDFLNNIVPDTGGIYFNSNISSIPETLKVVRCSFVGAQTNSLGASALWFPGDNATIVNNCLFANNTGGRFVLGFGSGARTVRNCTFANNQLAVNTIAGAALGVVIFGGQPTDVLQFENSIVIDNILSDGSVPEGLLIPATSSVVMINSIVETPANSTTISRPIFVDASNDNFRLQPNSPGVNAGTVANLFPPAPNYTNTFDLAGLPRVAYGKVDLGSYEGHHIAFHGASKSRVGENAGGPYDVLQVNGSSGGAYKTVTVPLGSASTIGMLQPPNLPGSARFVIFGYFARASRQTVTNVPLGIGDMIITPCPLDPLSSVLFTMTNNMGVQCPEAIISTPTPWNSPPFPAIFSPMVLTFQGLVEESQGVLTRTNMIIFEVQ